MRNHSGDYVEAGVHVGDSAAAVAQVSAQIVLRTRERPNFPPQSGVGSEFEQ